MNSTDNIALVAATAGAQMLRSPYSMSNNASIKHDAGMARGRMIVFMDADAQQEPENIATLLDEGYDTVGARDGDNQTSRSRGLADGFYNRLSSWMTGHQIRDLADYRADKFRGILHLLPNSFSCLTTITMAFFSSAYPVAHMPTHVNQRIGKSHIRLFRDGMRLLPIIFKIATLFVPIGLTLFLAGVYYHAYTFNTEHHFTNMSTLSFSASVIIFLIGFISEQITNLTYRRYG